MSLLVNYLGEIPFITTFFFSFSWSKGRVWKVDNPWPPTHLLEIHNFIMKQISPIHTPPPLWGAKRDKRFFYLHLYDSPLFTLHYSSIGDKTYQTKGHNLDIGMIFGMVWGLCHQYYLIAFTHPSFAPLLQCAMHKYQPEYTTVCIACIINRSLSLSLIFLDFKLFCVRRTRVYNLCGRPET